MLAFTVSLLILSFRINCLLAAVIQVPFESPKDQLSRPRKLHGRFLHITDMHPDPHYRTRTSQTDACHRKHPAKKGKNDAGYYGSPYSDCDSPLRLTNFTLDYLDKHWASEIDFVIWTGDNARHDNDRHIPRTPHEIYDLNRAVASKMHAVFSTKGIPVIPSLGNNDVWPHNILTPGPNSITNEYSSIWKPFIPFPYLQVFQRGAYYSVDIVPDQLAAISLNTMYFYDSNKVVSGCPYDEPDDPGNLQLDWLEVQLNFYNDHNMQVWITGHVPPSPGNYFPECYVRYVELALRFQNIILGHLYGHMNVDHFFFLEGIDLQIVPEEKKYRATGNDGALYDTLLTEFAALPPSKKVDFDEYAVVNVAPAVVPNPYLPSFRIFSYNVTETIDTREEKKKKPKRDHGHKRGDGGNKTTHCQTKKYQKTWTCHLNEPWNSDPDSPSRSNHYWTPLGYAQYNLPNLHEADKRNPPQFQLEYVTFPVDKLRPTAETEAGSFSYPIPLRHLPEELKNSSVAKSSLAPYRMEDLTIPSWVKLGRRLADENRTKLRKKFRRYMFAGRKNT